MRFKDLIGIIWRNMWKRKARTIFTMSGVIIGCLAVFIIVSITNGFEKYLNESMNGLMDTSVITVQPFWAETNEDKNTKTTLDDKCVEEIKKLDFVENVTPKRT
ncbi:MAG: ABC transporter permease, partial [Clostridiaceae bacterium]|nr:ABC transporter permease [Clostridiaceae bacterium]